MMSPEQREHYRTMKKKYRAAIKQRLDINHIDTVIEDGKEVKIYRPAYARGARPTFGADATQRWRVML